MAVGGAAMAGKASHEAKPSGPLGGLYRRTLSPINRQSDADVLSAVFFHEADKSRQQQPFAVHFVAQPPAQIDVFLQGFAQGVHRSLPGHDHGPQGVQIHLGVDAGALRAAVAQHLADLGQRRALP